MTRFVGPARCQQCGAPTGAADRARVCSPRCAELWEDRFPGSVLPIAPRVVRQTRSAAQLFAGKPIAQPSAPVTTVPAWSSDAPVSHTPSRPTAWRNSELRYDQRFRASHKPKTRQRSPIIP